NSLHKKKRSLLSEDADCLRLASTLIFWTLQGRVAGATPWGTTRSEMWPPGLIRYVFRFYQSLAIDALLALLSPRKRDSQHSSVDKSSPTLLVASDSVPIQRINGFPVRTFVLGLDATTPLGHALEVHREFFVAQPEHQVRVILRHLIKQLDRRSPRGIE